MQNWGEAGLLDHCESLRSDATWVAAQWASPQALLLAVDELGRVSAGEGLTVPEQSPHGAYDAQRHFLLGLAAGRPVFVQAGETDAMASLRELMPVLDDADRELVVKAVALVNWHRTSPHCSVCGSLTVVTSGGLVRYCGGCRRERFPRSDPAIIVAVVDADDRLLLGHQVAWPTGRMSILAGFVSAGESLEMAVHREVGEESGLRLSSVRYVGSQPWPLPRSLMLGFVARAAGTRIEVDGVEIEHARWFTREELTAAEDAGEVSLPGSASIASRLVAEWRSGELPAPEG
ncbi:NAD(+) diphosphatase [Micropruina sp.]|uniref:NAD(+) diphosphatase n=1 Tax=Micropruina sp. TaxID=2737536 RepID=UPI0039E684EA